MSSLKFIQGIILTLSSSFLIAGCADGEAAAKAAKPALPAATDSIVLGMGCFWGAEKRMAAIPGVLDVESGYANGEIAGTYDAVLAHERMLQWGKSTRRNHAEVVKVTFDPAKVDLEKVLIQFWESHNPTQGNRQGNDVGTNYRSAIYSNSDAQQAMALKTRETYQAVLTAAGLGRITTEIAPLEKYFPAEEYHQDYLVKNPNGYCGLGGTGVKYPLAGAGAAVPPTAARKAPRLDARALDFARQLIVFASDDCAYCSQFKADVLDRWQSPVAVVSTLNPDPPVGWLLETALFATPTIVLFEKGREISRYTGYNGDTASFWKWLAAAPKPAH